jgi:hypothetical protein
MKESKTYYHNSIYDLHLDTSQIPNAGLGVFTKSFIPKDSLIDEYYGMLRDHGGNYSLLVVPGVYIDASFWPRCYMGIINDCTFVAPVYKRKKGRRIDLTPDAYYDEKGNKLVVNCEFRVVPKEKKGYVYSTIDILPGQELFISYGDKYW